MDGKADGWQISSESKFEWEIRDYASGVQLVRLNSAKQNRGWENYIDMSSLLYNGSNL